MRNSGIKQINPLFIFLKSSKLFAVIGLFLIFLVVYPLVKKIDQQTTLDQEIEELAAEIEGIDDKNGDLRDMIDYLESTQFIEKEARLNLDLKKPGEQVVVVKNETESNEDKKLKSVFIVPGLDKNNEDAVKVNPVKWFDYFFAVKLVD